MSWTDEQILALQALRNEGLSATIIAARLRKTRNAVIGKLNRMGMVGKDPTRSPPNSRQRVATNPEERQGNDEPLAEKTRPSWQREPNADQPRERGIAARSLDAVPTVGCLFPIGDPRLAGFKFCCAPRERSGTSYCDKHTSIAYRDPVARTFKDDRRFADLIHKHDGTRRRAA